MNEYKPHTLPESLAASYERKIADNLKPTKPDARRTNHNFILSCLNSDFPGYFVKSCSPNSKTLKFSLMSVEKETTEKWVDQASSGKRYDFSLKIIDPKTTEFTDKFLVLNCNLVNKSLNLSYDKDDGLDWELEFKHSYFGEDKPQQRVFIDGKEYDSYGYKLRSSYDHNFLLKQQKEEFDFVSSNFWVEFFDNGKTYGPKENHLFYGISENGWLKISPSKHGQEDDNHPGGYYWQNSDDPSSSNSTVFIK